MTLLQRIRTPFTESAEAEQPWAPPGQRQVGDVLQERREDLGLDLDEIGAMLRIRPAYLAALEQGRSNDLPGPAYAIGFVRAYADFLGLDTEQVLTRFRGEAVGITARPDLTLPVPLGERSLPGRALVLVAIIVTLCGYGIWYYFSTENRSRPERVSAVPADLRAPTAPLLVAPPTPQAPANPTQPAPPPAAIAPLAPAAPTPPAAVQPSPPAAIATPLPTQSVSPAPAIQPVPAKPAPPAAAAPSAATPPQAAAATPPAPPPGPAPTAASKISIRALADCWIQIRGPDQSIVFSRILKSGEVYNVPARQGLWLRTGNAGVLEIAVDGKTVPSIGGIGTLRRDVALDPVELVAGKAVHG